MTRDITTSGSLRKFSFPQRKFSVCVCESLIIPNLLDQDPLSITDLKEVLTFPKLAIILTINRLLSRESSHNRRNVEILYFLVALA
jgi:hypothetical protein